MNLWFINMWFISYIRKFCFLFFYAFIVCFELHNSTVSIYFQSHRRMKHLDGGVFPFLPEIPSVSSEMPPCRSEMKNVSALKHNITFIRKLLYACHPVYCLVQLSIKTARKDITQSIQVLFFRISFPCRKPSESRSVIAAYKKCRGTCSLWMFLIFKCIPH